MSKLTIFGYDELVNPKTVLDRSVYRGRRYVELVSLREVVNLLKARVERRCEKYFDKMRDKDYNKMIRDSLILEYIDELFGEVLEKEGKG